MQSLLFFICLWRVGICVAVADGGGTLLFLNYGLSFILTNAVSGYYTNEHRPVFLPDGITKAAGSNYVVELWAANYFVMAGAQRPTPRMELLATTHLLDGDQAGHFRGGDHGYVEVSFIPGVFGYNALLCVRIWDKRTGSDFDGATTRGSVSFDNSLGGAGSTPSGPSWLYGFPPLCLNGADGATNRARCEFAWEHAPHVPILYQWPRSFPSGIVPVRRVGRLDQTNTVDFITFDQTAVNGQQYIAQSGRLTFRPGEALTTFSVPVLTNGLEGGQLVSVGLQVLNPDSTASLGVTNAAMRLYDDRPRIGWVELPGEPSQAIEIRSYRWQSFRLQHTEALSHPAWTDPSCDRYGSVDVGEESVEHYFNEKWSVGFYRAAPR
jgi:hypothetical protein